LVPEICVVPEQLSDPSVHVQEADPLKLVPETVRVRELIVVVPPSSG
jgi:hypothetical protein